MSEMPIENLPGLAYAAHQAADGHAIYLTEGGRRLAAIVPAETVEEYRRLREEAEITKAIHASLANPEPSRVFTSTEEMLRAAGQA